MHTHFNANIVAPQINIESNQYSNMMQRTWANRHSEMWRNDAAASTNEQTHMQTHSFIQTKLCVLYLAAAAADRRGILLSTDDVSAASEDTVLISFVR